MTKKDNGIVNIHGKEYKTVALRVSEFRNEYPISDGWAIVTEIMTANESFVVMRAAVIKDGIEVATGHAEEKRGSTNINKTSALENAETSAIGRALSAAGMGGTEYASADEVANAISMQAALRPYEAWGSKYRDMLAKHKLLVEWTTAIGNADTKALGKIQDKARELEKGGS